MEENATNPVRAKTAGNGAILAGCLVFVFAMVGMAYAAVPLYRLFCQVTGYNGTVQRVEQASETILDRKVKVGFDANVAPGLHWRFSAPRQVEPRIGETLEVRFTATNLSSSPVSGSAIFNVSPLSAGAYFNKMQCFCFTETELQPGETLEMPVVFFIDPDMASAEETKYINNITLSYTFHPTRAQPVAALAGTEKDGRL